MKFKIKDSMIEPSQNTAEVNAQSQIPSIHSSGWERTSQTSYRAVVNKIAGGDTVSSMMVSSSSGIPLQYAFEMMINAGWQIYNWELDSRSLTTKNKSGVTVPIYTVDELNMIHPESKAVCEFSINMSNSDVEAQKQSITVCDNYAIKFSGSVLFNMTFYTSENSNVDALREDMVRVSELFQIWTPKMGQREKSTVGMVAHTGREYTVKEFPIKNVIMQEDSVLNAHYGEGFSDWCKGLLERMEKQKNGLVLMHGEPGTGKTQFIRQVLNSMLKMKKAVLYVPPSFSAQLLNPDMLNFITDWVHEKAEEEGKDCVLLIEDAEPLLEIRHGADGRTTGISNLLNMTDGLLGDILGLTVMATFNTQLAKIDPALLRPQRLIARKEFGKLSREQAEKLAEINGTPVPDITYPASLAEYYSTAENNESLTHVIKKDTKIGFK